MTLQDAVLSRLIRVVAGCQLYSELSLLNFEELMITDKLQQAHAI